MDGNERIEARIAELREELEELKGSIPAHSTSIHHIAQIEDLEEEIERLEREREGPG